MKKSIKRISDLINVFKNESENIQIEVWNNEKKERTQVKNVNELLSNYHFYVISVYENYIQIELYI